ncbi:MAG: hypothetical protein ACYDC2_03185 [Solirubrobacteraceae bacterium]
MSFSPPAAPAVPVAAPLATPWAAGARRRLGVLGGSLRSRPELAASWHDFLFASLDPSGVMTVDKPPLSLWVSLGARAAGAGARPGTLYDCSGRAAQLALL